MATKKNANVLARVEPEVKEMAESIMSKLGVVDLYLILTHINV